VITRRSLWVKLGLSARSTFLRSLTIFFAVVSVVYVGVWFAVSQLFEFVESKTQIVAVAASSITQTIFGVPIGLEVSAVDGAAGVKFQFEFGVFPTLLVGAFLFLAAWNTRKEMTKFETGSEKFIAALAVNVVMGLSISLLLVVQNFAVDRYAVVLLDFESGRISVAPLGAGDLAIVFLLAAVGGLSALSAAVTGTFERFARALNWFFFVLFSFLVLFLLVSVLIGATVILQELIDVDFVAVNEVADSSEGFDLGQTWWVLGVLLFLPTLLGNLVWLSFGSSFGVQQDPDSPFPHELLGPIYSQLGDLYYWDLFQRWSAWDVYGAKALLALVPIVLVAIFAGAAGANRTGFRPKSFWILPIFLAGGVLLSIPFWRMTSLSLLVRGEILFGNLEGQDAVLDEIVSDGLQVQTGGTEVSAVFAALVIVSFAFLGARLLGEPLRRVFPRLMSFVSFEFDKNAAPLDRTRGAKYAGRLLIVVVALPPLSLLSVAGLENIAAHQNGADEFAQETVASLLNGDIPEVKLLFAGPDGAEWFADDILEAARISSSTQFEITIRDSRGGPLETNETSAQIFLDFAGTDPLKLKMDATASLESEIIGVTRYKFAGQLEPSVVDLLLPRVLTDAGVESVSVNGQSVSPNTYAALPGTYSFETEGRGIVSETESSKVLTSGQFSPDFSPTVILDSKKDAEMSEAISTAAELCAEVDTFGNSSCFDTAKVSGEPRSLNGTVPNNFYDFVALNDYAVESAVCDEYEDVLNDAFTLTRSTNCVWEIDRTQIYYGRKTTNTPVYSTGITTRWVPQCERVYYWFLDDYEWGGCYRDTEYQYQSGTTTSYSRGTKLFEGRFRYELSGVISVTAKLENTELVFGEPTIVVK
jgi:hypothetical protein